MNGLASLPVKRFDKGGNISGPLGAIGTLGGLNSPVNMGLGAFNPTPLGIAAALNPTLAVPSMTLSAMQALANMISAQQEAAPIENAAIDAGNPLAALGVAVSPVAEAVAPQESAIAPMATPDQTAALAAMNEGSDSESDDAAPEGGVGVGPAIADNASIAAIADSVAAAVAAANADAGNAPGTASPGGGGSGTAADGTAGVGSESGHAADGNNASDGPAGGEGGKEGGMIELKKYAGGGYASPNFYPYSQPTMMAGGGLAAAKRTQDAGRGPDSMLVHMAPQEVAGLQALAMAHGGSLTINPQTGLPEAGFLSSLLPTLVGAALTVGSQGAINPYMAAAIVGGGTTLATGSLKKGLFAGLGAFGGGNIGEGLSAAAGTELVTPATPMTSPVTQVTPNMVGAPQTITPEMLDPNVAGRFNLQPTEAFGKNFNLLGGPGAETVNMSGQQFQAFPTETGETVLSPTAGGQSYYAQQPGTFKPLTPPPVENARDALLARGEPMQLGTYGGSTSFERAGKGLQNIFSGGEEGKAARAAFGEKAGYGSFSAAASPILNAEPETVKKPVSYIRPYDVNITNRSAEMAPLYGPGSTSQREMLTYNFSPRPIYEAAGGGLMSLRNGGTFDDEPGYDGYAVGGLTAFAEGKEVKKSKRLGGNPYYKFAHDRKDTSMEAALDANFAKGGSPRYLNGAGDGMSDDIPAVIDGRQPARLADGEFVIPADVVSHLGNGSSKAGAKKLYAMMDKIRKDRTGRTRQAPEIKATKYMPA